MYHVIQCRAVEGKQEVCNKVNESGRHKEALGQQKQMFNSHMDMLAAHEMDAYWDDVDVDLDNFLLLAYDAERKIIYSYRVILEEVDGNQ